MIKYLKKNLALLICLAVLNSTIVVLCLVKTDYEVIVPAYIDSVGEIIQIDNDVEMTGSINTVSVYSYTKISVLSFLLAKLNKYATLDKIPNYYITDTESIIKSGTIQKNVSYYNAIISAYKTARCDIEYKYYGQIIHTLATYADSDFLIGDIILRIDGQTILENNDLKSVLGDHPLFDKTYIFTVLREGKEIDLEITPQAFYEYTEDSIVKKEAAFGIAVYEYAIPRTSSPTYEIFNGSSIGPSGGLMQAFYIYDVLTGGNLSKDLKIVGTGTVKKNGKAGPIGGIYQKVIAAHFSKADIFFVPVLSNDPKVYQLEDNYKEALRAYNTLKTDMKLIPVNSLDNIILKLREIKGL